MKLAAPLAIAAALAVLLAGCGSSSSGGSSTGGARTSGAPSRQPTGGAPLGARAKSCDGNAADTSGLRVTGISCGEGRRVLYGWQRSAACAAPGGASRSGCAVGPYRCEATRAERGLAVSCSRPGRSLAFVARRR